MSRLSQKSEEFAKQKHIVTTTHYSGIGCAELGMAMLGHELGINIRGHSACESDPTCREFLLKHKHCPNHVFGDIEDRVPPEALKKLRG
eukprot:4455288-Pyramimonas_sp.AAC.1